MLGSAKEKMAERMMSQITPSETAVGQAAVKEFVAGEARIATATQTLLEAAGLDRNVEYNPQKREQLLLGLADAVADRRVESWWWETVAPKMLDNAEQARQYVGLDADKEGWHDQIRAWHDSYHDAGIVDKPAHEADPADIGNTAARHVESQFGLTLPEFIAVVVNWDRSQMRPILRGAVEEQAMLIEEVAADLDDE